jgi:hypothetical protein
MCALVVDVLVAGGALYARWVSPLLLYFSACRVSGDTTFVTNTTKASMAGDFSSKNQRVANRRAARELATEVEVPFASNPRARVGRRERGGRALARKSCGITISSRATAVQNLQSQVRQLHRKGSADKAERHWRVIVNNQKDAGKTCGRKSRRRISSASRQKSSVERLRRKCHG